MRITWEELSREEQEALERLSSGLYLFLTNRVANRLKESGLAEQKLGGTGISVRGRELLRVRRRGPG